MDVQFSGSVRPDSPSLEVLRGWLAAWEEAGRPELDPPLVHRRSRRLEAAPQPAEGTAARGLARTPTGPYGLFAVPQLLPAVPECDVEQYLDQA
ncbi:hypothetical protein GCM10010313_01420 [Streptomyces violarus]|nr:hypothetical protein GCM10010313_01420 [Streptomyces violarus]